MLLFRWFYFAFDISLRAAWYLPSRLKSSRLAIHIQRRSQISRQHTVVLKVLHARVLFISAFLRVSRPHTSLLFIRWCMADIFDFHYFVIAIYILLLLIYIYRHFYYIASLSLMRQTLFSSRFTLLFIIRMRWYILCHFIFALISLVRSPSFSFSRWPRY